MKEGLIEARVNKLTGLSQKIKEFIHEKTALQHSPFKEQAVPEQSRSKNKAKRSLTDWRQLYRKNQNKIVPRHTVYPATADGERIRCSMTGQCNRRKIYSSANKSYGERSILTRQTRRQKWSEVKRESMMEFAMAQNIYQNQVLADDASSSTKDRKFYHSKFRDSKRQNYTKVGQYLAKVDNSPISQREVNATQEYINRQNNEFKDQKIVPFNKARIKQSSKLNNDRFLESIRLLSLRQKGLHSENGLRFYQRS